MGSTRGLVDTSESLSDSYVYSPYGTLTHHEGDSANSFLFAGEQRDDATEDYFLRARYYSPNTSRFLSRDTYDGVMENPITLNHYAYGNGNPTRYTDPSGRYSMGVGGLSLMTEMVGILSNISLVKIGVASGLLFNLRANKIYDISRKTSVFLQESNKLQKVIQHMYINASEIEWTGKGYRYDVSCANPSKAFKLGITPGGINKSDITSSEWTNTSFVKLSPLQFSIWEQENYELNKNRNYHLLFSSCWTWSYSAWISGLRIMLTTPSI